MTHTFTVDQIKEIYNAGVKRGNDEAVAFEWGGAPQGNFFDGFIDAVHEIVNEGIKFDDPRYVDYDTVKIQFEV